MKKLAVGCAGVALMLLAGCAQGGAPTARPTVVGSGPGGSAAPSVAVPSACPGAPGSSPTPCTAAQVEELRSKAALYAEAEQVYRKFFEEDSKLGMAGKEASGPVLDLLAGPFVESYKNDRAGSVGMTATRWGVLKYVRPAPGAQSQGSDVALFVCSDGSQDTAFRDGKELGKLDIVQSRFYLKRVDGVLKIWWQDGAKVESC